MKVIGETFSFHHKRKGAEEVRVNSKNLPDDESSERIMRHEKFIQKSIYHNLSVLNKLQTSC